MLKKNEYWTFQFKGNYPMEGPIDMGKPVTEQEIRKYIKKKYEAGHLAVDVWPHVPWWQMTAETHTVTERSTAMLKALDD